MSTTVEDATPSLGTSINVATRSVHTKLNKFIISRLSLVIPPEVEEPSNYVSGLLHVTNVYDTFESLWQHILQPVPALEIDHTSEFSKETCQPCPDVVDQKVGPSAPSQIPICTHLRSILEDLQNAELVRTSSLKEDVGFMTGWSPELLDEQLNSAADSPFLSGFIAHIRQSVQDRPHVLLAYAWVFYMALFSGGRYILASLSRVDPRFWTANLPSPTVSATALQGGTGLASRNEDSGVETEGEIVAPLRFFTFEGPQNGDEIKLAFKERLAKSESLLTPNEREEIVAEAVRIFEFMIEMVGELDSICRKEPADREVSDESMMGRISRLLGSRTRDSVVVTRERMAWAKLDDDDDNGTDDQGGDERFDDSSPMSSWGSSSPA